MSPKYKEPRGRQVEQLRFKEVGSRKRADSHFATRTPEESDRYLEARGHLYQYK